MRLGEDQIEFKFVNSMRYPPEVDCCCRVEEINDVMNNSVGDNIDDDMLKSCLTEESWMKKKCKMI